MRNKIASVLTGGAVALAAVLAPVATATPAQAHVSKCEVGKPPMPTLAGPQYVGGFGSYACEPYTAHHTYVEMKMEVQVLTLNLFGDRFDQFTTIYGAGNMSPRRVQSTRMAGYGYPTVAPCLGTTKVYRIKATLASVGPHGVRTDTEVSDRRALTCRKR